MEFDQIEEKWGSVMDYMDKSPWFKCISRETGCYHEKGRSENEISLYNDFVSWHKWNDNHENEFFTFAGPLMDALVKFEKEQDFKLWRFAARHDGVFVCRNTSPITWEKLHHEEIVEIIERLRNG